MPPGRSSASSRWACVGVDRHRALGLHARERREAWCAPTDPQTLVIELPEPVSDRSRALLARRRLARHRRQEGRARRTRRTATSRANWLKANGAGSGPFKLTQWRPNDILICERPRQITGAARPPCAACHAARPGIRQHAAADRGRRRRRRAIHGNTATSRRWPRTRLDDRSRRRASASTTSP